MRARRHATLTSTAFNAGTFFEDQWSGPSREKVLGLMDKTQFQSVLGLVFAGSQKEEVLDAICYAYGAGDPDLLRGGFSLVRWRQFAEDFEKVKPSPQYTPGVDWAVQHWSEW